MMQVLNRISKILLVAIILPSSSCISAKQTGFNYVTPADTLFTTIQPIAFNMLSGKKMTREFNREQFQKLVRYETKYRIIGKTLAYTSLVMLMSSIVVSQNNKEIGKGIFFSGITLAPFSLALTIKGRKKTNKVTP
jgi:hypothetical protein